MATITGVVWGRPLTWGTAATLHTAFSAKTGDEQLMIKCDFLCYVRWGDDVKVEGTIRTKGKRITDYRVRGRYIEASMVENTTLGLTFEHP